MNDMLSARTTNVWRVIIQLLDEASKAAGGSHGWTDEERALAREAVEWYRTRLPALAAPAADPSSTAPAPATASATAADPSSTATLSATAAFQRGRPRCGTAPARRSAGDGGGIKKVRRSTRR
jgi:hypothetical protein